MIPSQARLNIRCIARIFSDTIPEAGRLFLIRHAFELSGSQWLWLTLQRGHISRTLVYFQLVIDFLHAASAIAIPPLYEIVGLQTIFSPHVTSQIKTCTVGKSRLLLPTIRSSMFKTVQDA